MELDSETVASRCRIVLVMSAEMQAPELLTKALDGGDVASVIIAPGEAGDHDFADHCKKLVEIAGDREIASLVVNDTIAMGRSGADGLFVTQPDDGFRELAARFSPQKMIGFGGSFSRHRAMELGEANPDFLFFGKIGGDIRDDAHPKNLAIAEWWAGMVEIPCIVMGGKLLESVVECAASGAEFAALGSAVFDAGIDPKAAVAKANELLDQYAPIFDDQA